MKIALRQHLNGNKDPVLTITITDHPAYFKDCATPPNSDIAIVMIEKWMKGKLNVNKDGGLGKDKKKIL